MRTMIYLAGLLVFIAPSIGAADYSIRCESDRDNYRHCRARVSRGASVEVVRKFSKSSCTEGSSWGVDPRGIWVNNGCRAEFRIYDGYNSYDSRYDRGYDNGRGSGGGYGSYDGGYRQENRDERRRIKDERRELRRQRETLERERRELRKRKECPSGARVGRCSKDDRKRGCKDWKEPDGTPCRSGG